MNPTIYLFKRILQSFLINKIFEQLETHNFSSALISFASPNYIFLIGWTREHFRATKATFAY